MKEYIFKKFLSCVLSLYSPFQSLYCLKNIQDPPQNIIDALNEADQDDFPKLEHVGKIVYLTKVIEEKFSICRVTKGHFSRRILLRPGIVRHHYSSAYRTAFDNTDLGNIQKMIYIFHHSVEIFP